MQSLTSAGFEYLQLGPLDASDASGGVSPGQLCAENQFRFLQVIGARGPDLVQDFSPSLFVRTRVQSFDGSVVLIHEVVCQANHVFCRAGSPTARRLVLPVHQRSRTDLLCASDRL